MASISTFIAGFCTHRACIAVRGAGRFDCQFPAQCTLIESAGKLWLWDTGYSRHFFDATRTGVYQLYPKITPVYYQDTDAIVEQLAKLGIQASDLSAIIVSHFHADHIAGIKDFPQVPLIASQAGFLRVQHLSGVGALRQGFLPDLLPDDVQQRLHFVEQFKKTPLPSELAPFSHGYALPDSAGDVFLVALDGHACGQIGAFVHTDTGWLLLAADAAWSQHNYLGRPPSRLVHTLLDNKRDYYHTLDRLAILHARGIDIHLSHEVHNNDILHHKIDPTID